MAFTLDEVSIKGMRATHFEQLMRYLEWAEQSETFYGNKDQFYQRHKDLREWLGLIIDEARDPNNKIPK